MHHCQSRCENTPVAAVLALVTVVAIALAVSQQRVAHREQKEDHYGLLCEASCHESMIAQEDDEVNTDAEGVQPRA